MTSGIQSIVDTYVRLRRIDALASLRAHRRKLLAAAIDRSHFNFAVAREHYQRDIAVIDAGLNRVMTQKDWSIRGAMDPLSDKEITDGSRTPSIPTCRFCWAFTLTVNWPAKSWLIDSAPSW
jgi:hypothetical protein